MERRRLLQVDVFGEGVMAGNPLAVVVDAEGLSTETMQRLTRWTNLSEAAFLLPATDPEADYRVRIFTSAGELPFAGHPTLGACHAWLATGGRPRRGETIVQECGVGSVPVRREDGDLAFAAPPLQREGPVVDSHLEELTAVLGLAREDVVAARWVDNGPGWVALLLDSAEAVLAVEPDPGRWPVGDSPAVGLVGPCPEDAACAFEVRGLFTDARGRLLEDPVTGSLNAALGQWLLSAGLASVPYVVSQGTRLERTGRVRVDRDAQGTVWVGGTTTTVVDGHLVL